jgi:hypothetical protein
MGGISSFCNRCPAAANRQPGAEADCVQQFGGLGSRPQL